MDEIKRKCKHCGTEVNEEFRRKSGVMGVTICAKCDFKNRSKLNSGKNHHNYNKLLSHNVKGICKICGTNNYEDFKYKNGEGAWSTICTSCFIKNRSNENNPMFDKHHSLDVRKKQSESMTGRITPNDVRIKQSLTNKGKKRNNDALNNMSKARRYTLKDYQEKYPLLCLEEEMRELPESEWVIRMSCVQFRCKKCNDWFNPTMRAVKHRNNCLERGIGDGFFYCSNECKNSCPLFRLNINNHLNSLNNIEQLDNIGIIIWRKEVLNRQLLELNISINHCEKCNSEENLNVHHEKPQKTHPHLALDPDNGIVLCRDCHMKIGHSGECSTGVLASKICGPIKTSLDKL